MTAPPASGAAATAPPASDAETVMRITDVATREEERHLQSILNVSYSPGSSSSSSGKEEGGSFDRRGRAEKKYNHVNAEAKPGKKEGDGWGVPRAVRSGGAVRESATLRPVDWSEAAKDARSDRASGASREKFSSQ